MTRSQLYERKSVAKREEEQLLGYQAQVDMLLARIEVGISVAQVDLELGDVVQQYLDG